MYYPKFGVWLRNMPFDKSDGFTTIHATGRMVMLYNDEYPCDDITRNIWVNEYEYNAYDVPTYGFEDDYGNIIPLTEPEFFNDIEYIERNKEWIYQNENDINFDEGDVVAYGSGFWNINYGASSKYYVRRW